MDFFRRWVKKIRGQPPLPLILLEVPKSRQLRMNL